MEGIFKFWKIYFRLPLYSLILLFTLLGLISFAPLWATEIDNFSPYTKKIQDSMETLNQITIKRLEKAVKEANRRGRGRCQEKKLYSAIWKQLGGDLWGRLENLIVEDPIFDKHTICRRNSIYKDFTLRESFPMFLVKLGATIRMGDNIVGADKFGHFFAEGFAYFKKAYLFKQGVGAGIRYGERTEKGFYGLQTTGVYSYSDLSANYNGMHFWKRLLGRDYGPVEGAEYEGPQKEPYVQCVQGKWALKAKFDWKDYVDPAWDETINCSKYRTNAMARKVEKRVAKVEEKYASTLKKEGEDVTFNLLCPRSPKKCYEMARKYGALASRLLHPLCVKAAAEFQEREPATATMMSKNP